MICRTFSECARGGLDNEWGVHHDFLCSTLPRVASECDKGVQGYGHQILSSSFGCGVVGNRISAVLRRNGLKCASADQRGRFAGGTCPTLLAKYGWHVPA